MKEAPAQHEPAIAPKPSMLYIAHRIPYPPNKGDKIRSFNELKFFSTRYTVDLVAFYDRRTDHQFKEELKKYCRTVHLFFRNHHLSLITGFTSFLFGKTISTGCFFNPKVKKTVQMLIKKNSYALVFCYSSQVGQFAQHLPVPVVIDFIDVDSDKWKQYAVSARFPMSWVYQLEGTRLRKYENHLWQKFSLSVFSTRQELQLFTGDQPLDKTAVLSNGVDHSYFSPQSCIREKSLIFSFSMDYFPNVDAVQWFCKEIFPEVISNIPEVKLYIVGSNPVTSVQRLASPNIIVTGFVDDIRPWIARCALSVFPLRIARGIQNKILEAMSMGVVPLIPRSLSGSLDERWPEDVLFYDNGVECVERIITFLKEFSPSVSLNTRSRQYILDKRDWEKRLNYFIENHLQNLNATNLQFHTDFQ